jgi:hypothetical protein
MFLSLCPAADRENDFSNWGRWSKSKTKYG